ncbi:MAG: hypothetical protein LBH00_00995 [Planctomycetaceae bacterium]|nr:hypothetical protein [Planctomycetaceae bacterium]
MLRPARIFPAVFLPAALLSVIFFSGSGTLPAQIPIQSHSGSSARPLVTAPGAGSGYMPPVSYGTQGYPLSLLPVQPQQGYAGYPGVVYGSNGYPGAQRGEGRNQRRPSFLQRLRNGGAVYTYEYPEMPMRTYTTRGPRDFMEPHPPEIGY